jgi:DNA-3-methyladenine glycosylase
VLRRRALPRDTIALAKYLIGLTLVHETSEGLIAGRIVETEAYLGTSDPASHAFRGRTPRNASMFLTRGHAYVYMTYGMHFCLNVSGGPEGSGEAVLFRAIEPREGLDLMRAHRELGPDTATVALASGPGRLTQAFGVDRAFDGVDLCSDGPLRLLAGREAGEIGTSVRIGLTRAADFPLRFYERGNPHVSGPRRLSP